MSTDQTQQREPNANNVWFRKLQELGISSLIIYSVMVEEKHTSDLLTTRHLGSFYLDEARAIAECEMLNKLAKANKSTAVYFYQDYTAT